MTSTCVNTLYEHHQKVLILICMTNETFLNDFQTLCGLYLCVWSYLIREGNFQLQILDIPSASDREMN